MFDSARKPTLYPVDLYPLPDIHHLDESAFLGGDRVVDAFLVPDSRPVVLHGLVCVPAGILGLVSAASLAISLWKLTSGEESFTDRILAVIISSLSHMLSKADVRVDLNSSIPAYAPRKMT